MGFSISGVLGHCEPARCFTESLAFLTVVTKTIKSVFPFCCCSQYDGSILTIPANKLFNHVYCSPMFPTASQGSQLPPRSVPGVQRGWAMPALELGGLITAVTGYGPGTAHQKMVMKCVFVFPAFTIFRSVLCSSSLFPGFFLERHKV